MGSVAAKGSFQVECAGCGTIHSHSCFDLVWGFAEKVHKELGDENLFSAKWEKSCQCGQNINLEWRVKEYPLNCLNGEEVKVSGAKVVKFCNIGIKESVFISSTPIR